MLRNIEIDRPKIRSFGLFGELAVSAPQLVTLTPQWPYGMALADESTDGSRTSGANDAAFFSNHPRTKESILLVGRHRLFFLASLKSNHLKR